MLFAYDHNDNRIFIDDTHSNCEYYCPYCGAPLITKKGEIRQHHFAHKANHLCSDSWERTHSYDISEWHNDWQSQFPKSNQEIKLILGDTKHRADVMIGRTVIEFQHSIMPAASFDDRNNFYFNLGYKVVWLFDLSDLYAYGHLSYQSIENGLLFSWRNPKKAFNCYDVKSGCIDLFFQIKDGEEKCIVRITDVSEHGFEQFETTPIMDKSDFLEYVGLQEGVCAEPDRDDISKNESYQRFKEKYNIVLNKQQERALQAVEGANLLLAVPGSGKTTVLVARLGYMIIEKKIDPTSILAVTYNKTAALEMEARFTEKFGQIYKNKVSFRTLNSLALDVYNSFCRRNRITPKRLIEGTELRKLLQEIYRRTHNEYASENDILELQTAITYIKNMGLSDKEIAELNADIPRLSEMYANYQAHLEKEQRMDFDDQIVFAHNILTSTSDYLAQYRKLYRYICVDEAQDTSKLQHRIIELISQGNNLFMVGDEDQSIYGFRAAYPKALLNFRYTYRNPYILRMERNYRSTRQIVEKAQSFISRNKGRYEKNMVAERGTGEEVVLLPVKSRSEQFLRLVDIAREHTDETAFLYRDNESAVAIVDLFLRNNIPFKLRKPEMNFFGTKVVRDIEAYLSLALNSYDSESFEQICNKGILFIASNPKYYAKKNCRVGGNDIYQALETQKNYMKRQCRESVDKLHCVMKAIANMNTTNAIQHICDSGYESYMREKGLDSGKIEILRLLATLEPDKRNFLQRLKYLEKQFRNGFECKEHNPIILSTIHSSKGLEYDTVYMVDTYDGRFPSSRPNIFSRSKDNADGEQEERRLFYVGITRAKNRLFIMQMSDRRSSYISELFPELDSHKSHIRQSTPRIVVNTVNLPRQTPLKKTMEEIRAEHEKALLAKQKSLEELKRREYEVCYDEVRNKFTQQNEQIRDHTGRRWVKCEKCGEIKPDSEFSSYGGMGHVNLGICSKCSRGGH